MACFIGQLPLGGGAFSNVADIHWLYERAKVEHILPTDSFLKKLELKSESQKAFWEDISGQLEKEKTTKSPLEDYDLPAETRIFDSKWQFWWIPLVAVFTLPMCYYFVKFVFLETPDKSDRIFWFAAPVMILLTAKEGWRGIKMVFSKIEPQIILNNEGIELKVLGKKKWAEIHEISVDTEGYGEERKDTLTLKYITGDPAFTYFRSDDYEDALYDETNFVDEDDYINPNDFVDDIDEATYEANKSDSWYEKHIPCDSFIKEVQELTVSPSELEYLIKVYKARAGSNRRINV